MTAALHTIIAHQTPEFERLNSPQRLVMRLTAQGKSVKQISRETNLSVPVVKTHRFIARRVLGAEQYRQYVFRGA